MANNSTKRTEIKSLGEFGLINHLTQNFKTKNRSSKFGIGDDAAVIDNSKAQTVISTDMLVEGIHFDLIYTPLKHLGYKSVVVNLSDIYAMNAIPKQITVSIAISSRFSVEALEELYAGIQQACDFYGVDLIGGDTTSSLKGLVISITAIGQGETKKLAYRNGAKVGDLLCVTGDLGAAYLGLQILEREKQIYLENPNIQPDLGGQNYVVGRLLKPEARKDIVDLFEKAKLIPTAMIDISDGLASEVFHICNESKVGALVEEGSISIHPDTEQLGIKFGIDPTTCALNGGEDYELLFTVSPKDIEKVKYIPDVSIIGEILEPSEGVKLQTRAGKIYNIQAQGWQHFNAGK